MGSEVVDAQTFAHRQSAELLRDTGVEARVDERGDPAVGPRYAQRAEPSASERDRRLDDPVQRPVQVEIRTDLDDGLHKLFYLVLGCLQLANLIIHPAHQAYTGPIAMNAHVVRSQSIMRQPYVSVIHIAATFGGAATQLSTNAEARRPAMMVRGGPGWVRTSRSNRARKWW